MISRLLFYTIAKNTFCQIISNDVGINLIWINNNIIFIKEDINEYPIIYGGRGLNIKRNEICTRRV